MRNVAAAAAVKKENANLIGAIDIVVILGANDLRKTAFG